VKRRRAAVDTIWCAGRLLRASLAAGSVICFAIRVSATTIVVDSTADELGEPPNGNCTLREAVQAANEDHAVDACPKGSRGGDTILLPPGTYVLTHGGLYVNEGLDIEGAGRDMTTIDCQSQYDSTALYIDPLEYGYPPFPVALAHLTIQNGGEKTLHVSDESLTLVDVLVRHTAGPFPGDGIDSLRGVVDIEDSVVEANESGIVASGGQITIRDSVVRDNSSIGLSVNGTTASIERTQLVDNQTLGLGGAIYGSGSANVTIEDSTLSDGAAREGGAVYIAGGARISLTNSTASRNTAGFEGGAFAIAGGELDLENVTVADNHAPAGAAVAILPPVPSGTPSSAHIQSSIVEGDCDDPDSLGTFVSLGGNLQSSGDTCHFAQPSDLVNVPAARLGPLDYHGGATPTMLLLSGSPALDSLDAALCSAADQRGVARPQDGDEDGVAVCDRGAIELDCTGPDTDGDGLAGECDNCPNVANPNQQDSNGNGIGDACELFIDGFESGDFTAWSKVVQ